MLVLLCILLLEAPQFLVTSSGLAPLVCCANVCTCLSGSCYIDIGYYARWSVRSVSVCLSASTDLSGCWRINYCYRGPIIGRFSIIYYRYRKGPWDRENSAKCCRSISVQKSVNLKSRKTHAHFEQMFRFSHDKSAGCPYTYFCEVWALLQHIQKNLTLNARSRRTL